MKINDTEVEDANDRLQVVITKSDVRLGSAKNAKACAAAVALCRQTGCEAARVHLSRVYIKKDGKWTRFATPPGLRNEIIAFDRGGKFEPGEYTLTPVQNIVRFGSPERKEWLKKYRKRQAKSKQPQKGVRSKPHVVSGIRERMSTVGE
jgi:hypothetical protein